MLANPLWQYSLSVYKLPEVAELCLQLQDEYGFDINLIMAAAWLAECGQPLTEPVLTDLLNSSQQWQQQCLQPLREARRFLKKHSNEAVYSQSKQLELAVERLQQDQLYACLSALKVLPPNTALLQDNINAYVIAGGIDTRLINQCLQLVERLCWLLAPK